MIQSKLVLLENISSTEVPIFMIGSDDYIFASQVLSNVYQSMQHKISFKSKHQSGNMKK